MSAGADQSRPGLFGSIRPGLFGSIRPGLFGMKICALGPGVPVEEFVDVRLVDPGEAAGRQRGQHV